MSRAEQASIEAADWLIAQADGPLTPEEQARFDAWLAASDGNKAAYWRIEFGWREADRVAALGHAPDEAAAEAPPRRRRQWWIPAAIAASIALAIGVQQFAAENGSAPHRPAPVAGESYATAVGETRMIALSDGSRIQLNTGSKLRTRLSDARREVWLDEGEAFFEVAHEPARPFVVHAGQREITVLGTRFSMRRTETNVLVAVLEGRVQLAELEDGRPVRLSIISGGDIAVATATSTLVTTRSEQAVEQALSWRDGVLAFDQQPLSAIAEEFNRYNNRKLVLADPSTGAIRITGTFPSDKPDAFARLLRDAYGLRFDETEQEIRVYP